MKIDSIYMKVYKYHDHQTQCLEQELHFRIETEAGSVFTLYRFLLHDDDLTTRFDYLWERFGRELKQALLQSDEKTRPEGESQGGTSQVSAL